MLYVIVRTVLDYLARRHGTREWVDMGIGWYDWFVTPNIRVMSGHSEGSEFQSVTFYSHDISLQAERNDFVKGTVWIENWR